jgi:hypothetical protein
LFYDKQILHGRLLITSTCFPQTGTHAITGTADCGTHAINGTANCGTHAITGTANIVD